MTALLRFENVSKRFGGTQAVDDVTLDVQAGEVLALLGENGAGKSTLIKLLAGIHRPDSGQMLFDGQPESAWRSRDPLRQPVAFIHQDLGLVEWMTVAENVALGMGYPRLFGWKYGLVDWCAADAMARRVLARVGCEIEPGRRVFSLTRAEKSLLAIGRALEVKARLLVLDEPSASLPAADVQRLFGVLREHADARNLEQTGLKAVPQGANVRAALIEFLPRQFRRVGVAVCRRFGETLETDGFQIAGHFRIQAARGQRFRLQYLAEGFRDGAGDERRSPCQEMIQHRSERVHVAAHPHLSVCC